MPLFDASVETLDREELRRLQLDKLQALLGALRGKNRFYEAKWEAAGIDPAAVGTLDDLALLPLTTKAELVAAAAAAPPFGTNATLPESAYSRVHQTSGTTGPPLKVIDTPDSWAWWGRCWAHVLAGAGVTEDDRVFLPFSFGPFIGFWGAVEGARAVGALMIPGGGSSTVQRLHLIGELQPAALCSTPTYALNLAEVARGEGIDLRESSVRIIVTAGEPGASIPATKARIESEWGAKCFDHAGASEVGAHSFECEPQPGGIHPIESEYIIEVLDPATGAPTPDGEEGELIITNLGRFCYPVIRYRTGDLVRLNTDPCPCGRTYSRFEGGVLGRADDMVVVKGVNIFPSAIENLVRRYPAVDEYQVTVVSQPTRSDLAITIEVAPGADAEATRAEVTQGVSNVLGLKPRVEVADRGSLPRFELKAKRFHIET